MTKTIKSFLTLFALVSVLAACSSTPETTDTETAPEATPEPVVDPGGIDTSNQPTDADLIAQAGSIFYFEFDQSILTSSARSALVVHAEVLQRSPRAIRLEGHADERGSREYNMALGERRANAVRDFLVLQGVDSSLIETISYGEESPQEVGSYESAWSSNRRVELK